MENWNYAHTASRGSIARQHPYNYEMGLGRAIEGFEDHGLKLPGRIQDVTQAIASENNQRGFYGRWRQFMEAESWHELKSEGASTAPSAASPRPGLRRQSPRSNAATRSR
jgi:hypothetical protein